MLPFLFSLSTLLGFFRSKKSYLDEEPPDEVAAETNFSRVLWNKYGQKGQCWEREAVPKRGEKIKVASFNVLAQSLADKHRNIYPHLRNKVKYLDWEHRKILLSGEILRLNADILCLQEVEEDHVESFYRPLLEGSGYDFVFTKRKTPFTDGCLIAYRRTKWLVQYAYHFRVRPLTSGYGSGLDTPHQAQVLRLTSTKDGQQLVVCNTHLLFSPYRGDTKIGQLALIFSKLHQEGLENGRVPFLICGDFNTANNSPVTEFITQATINFDGYRQCDLSGQKIEKKRRTEAKWATDETALPLATGILRNSMHFLLSDPCSVNVGPNSLDHPFFIKNVFEPADDAINSPCQMTSVHNDAWQPDNIFFCNGLNIKYDDFIAFTGTLEVRKKVSLPPLKLINKTTGPWPNKYIPSDHIPLLVEFQLY